MNNYFFKITTIIFFLFPLNLCSQTPIIQTQYGPVAGQMNGVVYEFLGIPYAAPPVDTLRWRPTKPHPSWTTVKPCLAFAPKCPQKNFSQFDTTYTIEGNEDCLYLNIWSPNLSASLPVMVFIHGGGNQMGSASEISGGTYIYYGKNLAERGGVVVVTIQYRLGPLGFLVHPGLETESPENISGNYAVMDQIFALQWIQQNIANFGGNPNNVTIFGESAGGVNVGNLLVAQLPQTLFHKAIIQSAIPVLSNYNQAKNDGIAFVNQFFPTGTNEQKIDSMRMLHADSLSKKLESPLVGGITQSKWRPVIDNHIFTNNPLQIFQTGNFNHVPLMIGSNADEMSLSAPTIVTPAMVTALINAYVPIAHRPQALQLYPPGNNNTEARQSYVGLLTDAQFTAPVRRNARCIAQNQFEPVWRYFFTYKHSVAALANYGAYHGMELFYVFNTWENTTLGSGIFFKPSDDSVQVLMRTYWTNFAQTGNPNASGLEPWPIYNPASDTYIELKATPIGNQAGVRTEKSNFWDMVINFTGCTGSIGYEEIVQTNVLHIFPNPASDFLNIISDKDYIINVFSATGINVLKDLSNSTIDISGLSAGFYIIVATDKSGTAIQTKTFMKL